MDNSTNSTESTESKFYKYFQRAIIFILIFLLLTTNIIALSVSLQCNKGSNIFYKIASGMFAFMFGIIYLIFNYLMYRVNVNNDPCVICRNNIFSLS
jgi:hypothetical protein